jgi:hypothetical protein
MEINFKLDTEKATKATVAITASYRLEQVSEGIKYPQLAFTNAIALIAIEDPLILTMDKPLCLRLTGTPTQPIML